MHNHSRRYDEALFSPCIIQWPRHTRPCWPFGLFSSTRLFAIGFGVVAGSGSWGLWTSQEAGSLGGGFGARDEIQGSRACEGVVA